jgi:hypothetical protein
VRTLLVQVRQNGSERERLLKQCALSTCLSRYFMQHVE